MLGNYLNIVPEVSSTICGSIGTGLYARKYNIDGSSTYDCLIHTFASPCALCQEANEIKFRTHQQSFS